MTNLQTEPADPQGPDFDAELASVFDLPTPSPAPAPTPDPNPAPAGGTDPAPSATVPPEPTPTPEPSTQAPPEQPAPLPSLEQTPSPAPAPSPEPAAPAVDEKALEMASMRAQLDAATAELTRLRASPAPAATPTPTPGDPSAEAPEYGLSIPDQVFNAIVNEDPNVAKAGMNHMLNSLAKIIHTKVRAEYQEALMGFRGELAGTTAEAERQAAARQMQDEYFETFPQHKAPVLGPIITQVAAEMAVQFKGAPWDKNYIAALGQRVNAKLTELGVAPQPAPSPTPAPSPAPAPSPKPAAFVPTTPRHALESNSEEVTPDAVVDLFQARD